VNETDQYLAARPDPLMSNIVCVVCPRGVFVLGVLGASWAYLVFDLHGCYSALYCDERGVCVSCTWGRGNVCVCGIALLGLNAWVRERGSGKVSMRVNWR